MSIQKHASYEQDFYAWAMESAELLRQGRLSEIDIEHLAEEIESMGRSIKRSLTRRLEILFAHLLKWEYQDAFRGSGWTFTIKEQRRAITDLLEENPSLQHKIEEVVTKAYERAREAAADETELKISTFPEECPWTLEQALDPEFWPK
jgi:Domain of unknown function DUF29.